MNASNSLLRPMLRPSVLALAVMGAWSGSALAQSESSSGSEGSGSSNTTPIVSASGLSEPTRGLYYRLSQTLRFEDNLFRRSSNEDSDLVSRTAATIGTRLYLSRQVLSVEGTVLRNMYRDNDQLDGNGYRLNGKLQWELGSNLAGTLQAGASRDQITLDQLVNVGTGSVIREAKNQERTRYLNFDARYGLFSAWSIETFGDLTSVDYSQSGTSVLRDRDTRKVGVGVRYKPSPDLTLGLRTSYTDGEYPDDNYDRTDIGFTFSYLPGERLALNGELSYADEQHDKINARDFSGLTGRIRAVYDLTSKVSLNGGFSRQTQSGSTASERIGVSTPPGGTPVLTPELSFLSDARITNTLDFGATWAATSKIAVRSSMSFSRENLDRTLSGGLDENTTIRRFALGASWAVHRVVGLNCEYTRAQRDSVGPVGSYTANAFGCTASLALE